MKIMHGFFKTGSILNLKKIKYSISTKKLRKKKMKKKMVGLNV